MNKNDNKQKKNLVYSYFKNLKLLLVYCAIFVVVSFAVIFAINLWNEGYQFNDGGDICVTTNSAGGAKYRVYDTGYSGPSVFVPTKTTAEWNSFAAGKPAGITTAAAGYTEGASCNCNACGSCGGTITNACTGTCSGSTPATPYTVGAPCNRNACGGTGTITNACTGACSASAPALYFTDSDGDGYGVGAQDKCSGASQGGDCNDGQILLTPVSGSNCIGTTKYSSACNVERTCYNTCGGGGDCNVVICRAGNGMTTGTLYDSVTSHTNIAGGLPGGAIFVSCGGAVITGSFSMTSNGGDSSNCWYTGNSAQSIPSGVQAYTYCK